MINPNFKNLVILINAVTINIEAVIPLEKEKNENKGGNSNNIKKKGFKIQCNKIKIKNKVQ